MVLPRPAGPYHRRRRRHEQLRFVHVLSGSERHGPIDCQSEQSLRRSCQRQRTGLFRCHPDLFGQRQARYVLPGMGIHGRGRCREHHHHIHQRGSHQQPRRFVLIQTDEVHRLVHIRPPELRILHQHAVHRERRIRQSQHERIRLHTDYVRDSWKRHIRQRGRQPPRHLLGNDRCQCHPVADLRCVQLDIQPLRGPDIRHAHGRVRRERQHRRFHRQHGRDRHQRHELRHSGRQRIHEDRIHLHGMAGERKRLPARTVRPGRNERYGHRYRTVVSEHDHRFRQQHLRGLRTGIQQPDRGIRQQRRLPLLRCQVLHRG